MPEQLALGKHKTNRYLMLGTFQNKEWSAKKSRTTQRSPPITNLTDIQPTAQQSSEDTVCLLIPHTKPTTEITSPNKYGDIFISESKIFGVTCTLKMFMNLSWR